MELVHLHSNMKKRNYVVIFCINLVKLIVLTFRSYRILGPNNFSANMTLVGHVIYLYVNRFGFWTADWWQRSLGNKADLYIWWRNTQVAQSSHRTGVVTWCKSKLSLSFAMICFYCFSTTFVSSCWSGCICVQNWASFAMLIMDTWSHHGPAPGHVCTIVYT